MRISQIRKERRDGSTAILARVEWEESERPAREIFIQFADPFGDDLEPSSNAFFAAAYQPALRHGERRIRIEGSICPRLRDGLSEGAAMVDQWFDRPRRRIVIEPERGFEAPRPAATPRAAGCLSGGVDSSYLFFSNQRDFPPEHPERIRDALFVESWDFPGEEFSARALGYSRRVAERLAAIHAENGVRLVLVRSNVRSLEPGLDFLAREYLAASLAIPAIALSGRISSLRIASGADVSHLGRRGTHPMLDPCYSTAALRVRHEGIHLRRLEKVRRLADWPQAVRNLVVCNYRPVEPWLNCGVCEKCLATMLELTAAGCLSETASFPFPEVSPEMIERIPEVGGVEHIWKALQAEMERAGRSSISASIERLLRRTRRIGFLRDADRLLLGGRAARWRRKRRNLPAPAA
jgi:hypothetical protein